MVGFVTITLPQNPHRLSKPLRFELAGWRVARRGDYRVVRRLHEDSRIPYIGRVEHRARVYRRP